MTASALLDKAADALEGASHRSLHDQALVVARVILTEPASEGMVNAYFRDFSNSAGHQWSVLAAALLADLSPRASSAVTTDSEDGRATPDIGAGER